MGGGEGEMERGAGRERGQEGRTDALRAEYRAQAASFIVLAVRDKEMDGDTYVLALCLSVSVRGEGARNKGGREGGRKERE